MIYEFLSYKIPTFWLFALNGFDFTFLLPIHRSYIENISRIKRCDNLGFSLQFKPVCILNPICNLQSAVCMQFAFYTDPYKNKVPKENFGKPLDSRHVVFCPIFLLHGSGPWMNEWMKLYLISGLMRLIRPLAKQKYANKPREIKKRKPKNYLQNKT